MKNKIFLTGIIFFILGFSQKKERIPGAILMDKVLKSDQEWQTCLTPEEYQVLRNKGTERAFTGEYYKHSEKGIYTCAGCENELFSS